LPTIRDALKRKSETSLSEIQGLGIHLYSNLAIAGERLEDQIRLLDALYGAGAKPIVIYYLIQHAQRAPNSRIPFPSKEEVEELLALMPPNTGVFSDLPQQ